MNCAENYEFNSSKEFLEGITTVINCETDLRLYKYAYTFSNKYMSVVGIEILGQEL